jgi:hypothetical protein
MLTLPSAIADPIVPFTDLFSDRVFDHAEALLVGAILAPGKRTVTSALRALGLADDPHFQNFHRVLNRARWDELEASRRLFRLLLDAFAPTGPVLIGIDETIERRRGEKISARGIYRDPVRSSKSHFVKASGLRWLSVMLLARVPWAERVWALPFLTVLTPSERYYTDRGLRHRPLLEQARRALLRVRQWVGAERPVIAVSDNTYAALELLDAVRRQVTLITRLRLDAALYEPAPERQAGQMGRPRKKGARLPTLEARLADPQTRWKRVTVSEWYGEGAREVEIESGTCVWYHCGKPVVPMRWVLIRDPKGKFRPQALLSTDLELRAEQVLNHFVQRWQVETTFEESRAHLGVETQRQWSDLAIARTTPVLMGLFSLVTLMARGLIARGEVVVRQAAWYAKKRPTFSDTIALVRRCLWTSCHFSTSDPKPDLVKVPRAFLERLTDALCYAA